VEFFGIRYSCSLDSLTLELYYPARPRGVGRSDISLASQSAYLLTFTSSPRPRTDYYVGEFSYCCCIHDVDIAFSFWLVLESVHNCAASIPIRPIALPLDWGVVCTRTRCKKGLGVEDLFSQVRTWTGPREGRSREEGYPAPG